MKYTVEFYENANGESDIWNFLETLRIKSSTSKDARIQYKQLCLCIQLLENRIFYFYYKDNTFVLLHSFRKKSQKTPKQEIWRAKQERDDYLLRKEL